MLGLPNWDKPSMACLATRVPYGEPITDEILERIGIAEHSLRALGLRQFRVRAHGSVARIEVEPDEMERAWDLRDRIAAVVKDAGFAFAAQDLDGYRSGSMDRVLDEAEVEPDASPGSIRSGGSAAGLTLDSSVPDTSLPN